MKKLSRALAIVIALMMVFALVFAACEPTVADDGGLANAKTTAKNQLRSHADSRIAGFYFSDAELAEIEEFVAEGNAAIDACTTVEAVAAALAEARAKVNTVTGVSKGGYAQAGEYSYRIGAADLPTMWNPHTYTSNSSTYVLDYTTDGLYTFDYDESGEKFTIVPSMASAFPTDVTAKYVGQFGITQEDVDNIAKNGGKAYSIPLRSDLKFDNGEPITAESFVASLKLLLNPDAQNGRADNVYASGDLKIFGAENYLKQGKTTIEDVTGGEGLLEDEAWPSGITSAHLDAWTFNAENCFVRTYMLDYYASHGYDYSDLDPAYFLFILCVDDSEGSEFADVTLEDIEALEGKTIREILADEEGLLHALEALFDGWCTDPGEEFGFFCEVIDWEANYSFDRVGFFAEDGNLVIVLKNAMADNFYLRYELCTDFFLVYAPLYESTATTSQGAYQNRYGTSIDTYVGFGPYMLTTYVQDSVIEMTRNPNWWGYHDESRQGQYQTTRVVYRKVTNEEVRLQMFLRGELESIGLRAQDMATYGSSPYTYYTDGDSTWLIAMNPDMENLKTAQENATPSAAGKVVNKTVLTIDDFRKALSYSLDRQGLISIVSPTSSPASGLLSSMIISDPDNGTAYRQTEQAKDALLSFWGLEDWETMVDEDGNRVYETKDAAIASITGYDPAGAKVLFKNAYDQAIEQGLIEEGSNWEVQLLLGKLSTSATYTRVFEFFRSCWTNAVVGTPFEGRLVINESEVLSSDSFGEALRSGRIDLLYLVGYTGSQFNPFSHMTCYTGSTLPYDPFTDKSKVNVDITLTIEGEQKTLRASLADWVNECLQGNKIEAAVVGENGQLTGENVSISAGSSDDMETRLIILAEAEKAVLNISNIFPLMTDASASMKSMRINYKTEEYILGVGRGGLRYYTYEMDDAAWAAYVQANGGILNYLG